MQQGEVEGDEGPRCPAGLDALYDCRDAVSHLDSDMMGVEDSWPLVCIEHGMLTCSIFFGLGLWWVVDVGETHLESCGGVKVT